MKISIKMSEETQDGKGVQQTRSIELEGTREDAAVLFDALASEYRRYLPPVTRVGPLTRGSNEEKD